MKKLILLLFTLAAASASAQTATVTYQGRIKAGGALVDNVAQFAFAIVNQNGTTTYWSHDDTSANGSQPISTIQLQVSKGIFSIQLGDEGVPVHGHPGNIPGMVALPVSVFTNSPLFLRIWFDDGTRGMQQLAPDMLLSTAPFALHAEGLAPGSITTAAISDGAVTFNKIVQGAVGNAQMADNAVGTAQIGANVITASKLAAGAITGEKIASNSITSVQIAMGAVTTSKLADHSINTSKILNGAVTGPKLANDSIGTSHIQDGAITASKIALGAVRTTNLVNGTVGTVAMIDQSVTTPKLANGAVTGAKLAANSVTSSQIADGSVTLAKLASHNTVASFLTNSGAAVIPSSGLIFSRDPASAPLINAGFRQVGSINPRAGMVGFKKTTMNLGTVANAKAVWTGNAFILHGVFGDEKPYSFDPVEGATTSLTTVNGPGQRSDHSMNWANNSVVIWGGQNGSGQSLNTGAYYDTQSKTWSALTVNSNTPSPRHLHSAVWTGTELIVFGGRQGSTTTQVGGGRLPRGSGGGWGSWQALDVSDPDAPRKREAHCAVWTGSRMVIWGGASGGKLADGSLFDPVNSSNPWTKMSSANAPSARSFASCGWTGTEFIVWGGFGNSSLSETSGARYDPATDTWTTMSTANAPTAGDNVRGFWTGDYFVVFSSKQNPNGFNFEGKLYDPVTDTWENITAHNQINSPANWSTIPMAWSGTELFMYNSAISGVPRHLYRPPFKPLYLYQR